MPRKLPRKKDQSSFGLLKAIGVADAATLPRVRPMYRRIVELVERGLATGATAAGAERRRPVQHGKMGVLDVREPGDVQRPPRLLAEVAERNRDERPHQAS